ncbi:hypothetical protein FAZ95_11215 [Trinickia violacea]|uniref:Tetratricopeptide repeat protein n=1 Tax=Trinickia violacea TaxID=2571746 RepID=A0A4P8IPY7_9BURK|nr:hypothetical protein [Trinickia violacea]QCP49695.1 hypothetical protein FAZ95_11215 [Trinickia violacea]
MDILKRIVSPIGLASAFLLAGCATPTKPATVNQYGARSDAAHYRRIALLPMDGNVGAEATDDFERLLASVRYEGRSYFTIYEWREMDPAVVDLMQQSLSGNGSPSVSGLDPQSLAGLDPKSVANFALNSLSSLNALSAANVNVPSASSLARTAASNLSAPSVPNASGAIPGVPASVSKLAGAISSLAPKTASKGNARSVETYGALTRADAVYSGSANILPIVQTSSTAARTFCPSGKVSDCDTKEVRCTTKTLTFKLTPRLVAFRRGKVIYNETKTTSASSTWCNDAGVEASDQALKAQAMSEAWLQVREDIAPYEQKTAIKYKDDIAGLDPRSVEPFNRALEFARAGRFDHACPRWSSFVTSNPANTSVAFNVAACEERSGNLEAALKRYQQVDEATGKSDPDVREAIARVRDRLTPRSSAATPSACPADASVSEFRPASGCAATPSGS